MRDIIKTVGTTLASSIGKLDPGLTFLLGMSLIGVCYSAYINTANGTLPNPTEGNPPLEDFNDVTK